MQTDAKSLDPGFRRGDGNFKFSMTMVSARKNRTPVIPAQAGIQCRPTQNPQTPARAGMTAE
ncbi:MAG: hypothetical protein KF834_09360 [Burkholderiales bacterium]|nr:hypothetical protein [Burkholderiales bacterium]